MSHELLRCLLTEQGALNYLLWRDIKAHGDELCYQFYMDDLGHGINGKFQKVGRKIIK